MSRLFPVFFYLGIIAAPASGQTAGTIIGIIYDPSGAVIPGAAITVVNLATGEIRNTATDKNGYYIFPVLPAGTYDVSAEASGFEKQVNKAVCLNVAGRRDIDFNLSIGATSQTIEVFSAVPVIEKAGAVTGGVMQNAELLELPINGRDYARFSLLVPGAEARTNMIADLTFNGQHIVHNQLSIDGIDASRVDQPCMANAWERGARLQTGSLATISEFRVQTNSYEAQFGRAAGTYINIATRSGTNNLHGSAYDFLRNDILDARNFFAADKPAFRFNDFGASLGGPIRESRTFFFLNYEGSRQRIGIVGTGTVPSVLMRSRTLAISPALEPVLEQFPVGSRPTDDALVDVYNTTSVLNVREDTGSVRIDHRFSDADTAFVRININDSHVLGPGFGILPSALGVNDIQNIPVRTSNIAISDTHTFGPHLVNQVLIGMQRMGSSAIADRTIPETQIAGLTVMPGSRLTSWMSVANFTSYQAGDDISWTRKAHDLKFGGTIYRIQLNLRSPTIQSQVFYSLDDFINNRVASASVSAGDPGHGTRATQVGLYIQDTFRFKPDLTLNYGLRYDVATPPHDAYDNTQTFDPLTNRLAPPGSPYFRTNKANFGPRFSFAWSPKSALVIRGGFGVFYQAYAAGSGAYSIPINTLESTTLLRLKVPNLSYPFDSFLSQGLPNVSGFTWDKPDLYANQWNLSIGYQFNPGTGIVMAYVGDHGVNLRRYANINLYDPALGKRPIDGFADIEIESANAQNIYHGAQFSFIQRLRRGLQFNVQYTFAHAIDDVQDQGYWPTYPQDSRNLKAEHGNSSGDIRHNATFNLLYDLPLGRSRHFGASWNNMLNQILGGWRVASLGMIRTGIASTVYIPGNTYGDGNYVNQRPNWKGGGPVYPEHQTVDNFLNPDVYEIPAQGTFGNLGRNTFHGPGFTQIDVSFLKNFKISETMTVEYRCEIFNLANHPNFDQPNSFLGPGFGQIFGTFGRTIGIGTSRQIQMALKFVF